MTTGPQVARLRQTLATARDDQVELARNEWFMGAWALEMVTQLLRAAAPEVAAQFGPSTRQAAADAFRRMGTKVELRARQMYDAADALAGAGTALRSAQRVRDSLAGDLAEPAPFRPDPAAEEVDQLRAQRAHQAQVASYNAAFAEREERARRANERLDAAYASSTETMKRVHGEPDRRESGAPASGGGSAGGSRPADGATVGSTSPVPSAGGTVGAGPSGPGAAGAAAGANGGAAWATAPGVPQGPTAGSDTSGGAVPTPVSGGAALGAGTAGGVVGALGGGLVGGAAAIGGAIRGGAVSTATPVAATAGAGGGSGSQSRAIGATSRSGASSSLGRPGAAVASTGTSPGGAPTSGRSASTRGAAASTAGRPGPGGTGGAASGRTAGAGVGGAGGRGAARDDDRTRRARALDDDPDQWLDDEDGAPGVLG